MKTAYTILAIVIFALSLLTGLQAALVIALTVMILAVVGLACLLDWRALETGWRISSGRPA
jgi:hypothetical protein